MGLLSYIVGGLGIAILTLDFVKNFALNYIPDSFINVVAVALIIIAIWVAEK